MGKASEGRRPKSKVKRQESKDESQKLNHQPPTTNHQSPSSDFTHFGRQGRAKMVDVSDKQQTVREAVAKGTVQMKPATLELIKSGGVKKGDVLAVAQVAGIMAAKKTPELIPMCHPLHLTGIDIGFHLKEPEKIEIQATVRTTDRTGVEMEALVAVSAAALAIYDMCKAVDREITISDIKLMKKSGGKSGVFARKER